LVGIESWDHAAYRATFALHVVLEGISRGFSAVNIRKFVVRANRLQSLVELGSLSPRAAAFLDASVRAGLNILVAGGTQAGKTTLLNCLAAAIPGGERVVSVEEVFELRFTHPDWVALQTRQSGLEGTGEVRLRDLVKESLRMRPSRMIVGEVRAEECLDLLLALNAGLPGMCTIHANSAREALVKTCTLPLLAGANRGRGGASLGRRRRSPRPRSWSRSREICPRDRVGLRAERDAVEGVKILLICLG
jgi:pilus assembly protein CpaF